MVTEHVFEMAWWSYSFEGSREASVAAWACRPITVCCAEVV
jgi:hypothetical protein